MEDDKEPEAPPPFTLAVGDRLIRKDRSFLAVVGSAEIDGAPQIVVEDRTATGERSPHDNPMLKERGITSGHGLMPLSDAEAGVKAGIYTVGHAPVK